MVPQKPTESQYKNVNNVKELFDLIGKYIQQIAHEAALERSRSELHGFLSKVEFSNHEGTNVLKACDINDKFETNVTTGHSDPCEGRAEDRFSNTQGAQCDYRKIRGSDKTSNDGACAPYRRLHLCDQNLEQIEPHQIKNTHSLYIDVLLAAKYEGESIIKNYPQDRNNNEVICTALARSFADIGDIIRGKDLFIGYNQKDRKEKKQLQENLKNIFKNIHDHLTDPKAKEYYNDDNDENYYQLREDWWELNRHDVWKAITCDAPDNAKYFRNACSNDTTETDKKCQCVNRGDVPTYFDYVPQFLRWFEEWAEDFCRKKKKKVENAKSKCRNDEEQRYCSGNGYDCTKTVRAQEKYSMENNCPKCFFACNPFVKWLDNQKVEFLKQKQKYNIEINERNENTKKDTKDGPINKIYAKQFYDELNTQYRSVDDFLELLNKETVCQVQPLVKNKVSSIDFKNEDDTFGPTEYCKPCPICGGGFEKGVFVSKGDVESKCPDSFSSYDPPEGVEPTKIKVLISGENHDDINKKLDAFCKKSNNNSSLYEEWNCYHDKEGKDKCILQYDEQGISKKKVKEYIDFFKFWVTHMLDDSMEWKEKLRGCLKNGTKIKCKNGCKTPCKCYESWVEEKKKEWMKIRNHFYTQDGFGKGAGQEIPHYIILEQFLENEYFDGISDAYADPQHMEKITKTLEEKKKERNDDPTKKETIIDFLLEHEGEDAKKCTNSHNDQECNRQQQEQQKQQQQKQPTGGRARADSHNDPKSPPSKEEDEDEDEVEEEDGQGEEEEGESEEGEKEENVEEPAEKTVKVKDTDGKGSATDTSVDACATVAKLFKDTNKFSDACKLKYGPGGKEKFPNWKCIPSGDTTGSGKDGATGGLCIPPRRRKLYLHKVENDGEDITDDESLRKWFIETAAIETFFLWHRYKEEKKPQGGVGSPQPLQPLNSALDGGEETPEQQLKDGIIPEEFKRQMFYTISDYKDILYSGSNTSDNKDISSSSNDNLKHIVLNAGGDKASMEKIQKKIKEILPTSGSSPSPSDEKTTRESWWKQHAESIWNGMICALTYKTDTQSGQTPQQDQSLKTALLESDGKPQNSDYTYENVVLKEDKNSVPKGHAEAPSDTPTLNNPKLTDFVLRPPYFRYLEEWGQHFCKERKKRLEKIEEECMDGSDKKQKCSCYGEHCDDQLKDNPSTLSDLMCRECGKYCSSYRRWIERKKYEFTEQQKAYTGQKEKCQTQSNGAGRNNDGNEFYKNLQEKYNDTAAFLKNLGPCSKTYNENNNGDGKKIFENTEETFQHATNCKPCSEFKVDCKNCKSSGDGKKVKCNGSNGKKNANDYITASDIENGGNSTKNLDILVSDDNTNGNKFTHLQACEKADIFNGFREDKWKCRNVCGYVVCKPENGNTEKGSGKKNDGKHIITIRALVTHWVQYFLEDYNKIRRKLNPCRNNGEGYQCIKDCVEKWIKEKREEWRKIKERFNDQYKSNGSDDDNVRSVLETFLLQIGAANYQNKVIELSKFDQSCVCSADVNAQKDSNQDAIECMLKKLQKKIEECQKKHDENGDKTCSPPPQQTLDLDDDEPTALDEDDDKKVGKPSFCKIDEPPEPVDEETCKAADENVEETVAQNEESGIPPVEEPEDDTEKKAPVKPTPTEPQPPRPKTPKDLADHPAVIPALVTSTLAWSVGIGFAAFTYFYLKKKTKASVGNLFQILQIPKSDYDIPTKLSPNRYIPYTSGKYRGKRYIYLEGDSGTDSGYTDHYSDITSSSESEYEEMDINDIYVPGSPKYKTLIEVVLEPSGNNTTASGNNTTASGKNTPSDTQNDIPSDNTPSYKLTDEEWNQLKDDFISQYLQSEQPKDVPNDYTSGDIPFNTQPNTLYFDNNQEKPFITSIHDRNLYTGEEISYNIHMSTNSMDDIPISDKNDVYSGIDLINDALNGDYDIYDELLKRKENELFGTEHHPKHTTINRVAKPARDDPLLNQLELFHRWLDRHRNMCEQWNNKEELLDKLKEEWENETHSGNTHPSDSNKTLNTDVSIQIDMDNPKPTNEFTNMDTYPDNSSMDTILEDLDKPFNEPYYYDMYDDDIYYDVNDDNDISTVDSNAMDIPSKVQIEMDVNTKLVKEKYPIADVWDI
ncbi:erythrocyte membrane protein 1 [Plasmodium falciparum IGH-CR14]|uniref:Erythrocyte membrane protein 1 n=1 Tax=Plasmodium falciparum IGH-CR14 TaxID=580059 RepID=A0A0L1I4Y7_PLAFA|nr:erythrocyte membrane protein 1 [Plasmodium falciparum IGH-CR14]